MSRMSSPLIVGDVKPTTPDRAHVQKSTAEIQVDVEAQSCRFSGGRDELELRGKGTVALARAKIERLPVATFFVVRKSHRARRASSSILADDASEGFFPRTLRRHVRSPWRGERPSNWSGTIEEIGR